MLSVDPGSVRASARQVDFASIGALVCSVALFVAGSVLLYVAASTHQPALPFFGAPINAQSFAAAVIILALALIVATAGPALRSIKPDLFRVRQAEANAQGEGFAWGFSSVSRQDETVTTTEVVGLRLSEPIDQDAGILLIDAVRCAYRESQGTATATFANAYAGGADDVLTMYATFFAEHVPIVGARRPSLQHEQVHMGEPPKAFVVEDGCLILKGQGGADVYDDLRIRAADYAHVLDLLRQDGYRR